MVLSGLCPDCRELYDHSLLVCLGSCRDGGEGPHLTTCVVVGRCGIQREGPSLVLTWGKDL